MKEEKLLAKRRENPKWFIDSPEWEDGFKCGVRDMEEELSSYKAELREKVEGMKGNNNLPIQTGLFSNCPKCGQEVNIKFVGNVLQEVRNQALSEVLKLLT